MRRAILLGAALLAVGALAHPAPAASPNPFAQFRDRVIDRPTARAAGTTARAVTGTYPTPDGTPIEVAVAESVPERDATAQGIVNFLGSRLHGAELAQLRVFVATPPEVNAACGGGRGVLACYAVGERRMYVPDRDPGTGGPFTRDYAITHEYGHHLAAFRSNAPFPAISYGAKYWSSHEFVCAGVDRGAYFPGDQGDHYLDDPGEAFADAYAHVHYPDVFWQYNATLRPDAAALEAVRRDVLDPWRAQRRRVVRGSLNSARRSRATIARASLDGTIELRLSGPRRANFDLALYDGGKLVSRTRAGGSRDRLRAVVCRDGAPTASGRVRIVRRSGAGAFRLTILYPG
jgi:hypothetical protein